MICLAFEKRLLQLCNSLSQICVPDDWNLCGAVFFVIAAATDKCQHTPQHYEGDDADVQVFLVVLPERRIVANDFSVHGVRVADYVEKWMNVYKANKLKPSTIDTYKKHLRAHILPAFGQREIASITTEDIQLFLNERKHLAKKTLTSMRHFMGEVFKDAVEDGIIAKDPTASRRITIPSTKAYEREALPLDQFKEIIASLDLLSPADKRMLVLMMFTGMRRGEVLGLRWEDVDTKAGLIHIRRNVIHAGGNKPVIGTPKTKSGERNLPLDPFVLEALEPMQESGFINGGESPITMTTYNNTWKRIGKTIDLHGATAHVFRHSYLTYMAGQTADLKTLQAIAGHSTIGMTMNRYVHAQPEKIIDAGKKMHSLLAG